jgi:hypothetical protein
MVTKISNCRKIDQMATKYTDIFPCKTLRNLPKIGIFGSTICHLAALMAGKMTWGEKNRQCTQSKSYGNTNVRRCFERQVSTDTRAYHKGGYINSRKLICILTYLTYFRSKTGVPPFPYARITFFALVETGDIGYLYKQYCRQLQIEGSNPAMLFAS